MTTESEWKDATPLEAHQALVLVNMPAPIYCRRGTEGYEKMIRLEFATNEQRDAALSAIKLAMEKV